MLLRLVLTLLFVGICVSYPTSRLPRESLDNLLVLQQQIHKIPTNEISKKCLICKVVTLMIHSAFDRNVGKGQLKRFFHYICNRYKIVSLRVCIGAVDNFSDDFWNVLVRGFIKPHVICGMILGEKCAKVVLHDPSWNITIPKPTKSVPPPRAGVKTGSGATIKVLHISDTHLDKEYEEGRVAHCGEPLCCRRNDKMAGPGETAAGKYGYSGWCDTSTFMLHSMLSHIAKHQKDIEYVLWTGDVPPHDVWNQSRSSQKDSIIQAAHFLRQYLPNITTFPALGNHEGVPVNSFPPPEIWKGNISDEWLYDTVAQDWKEWLPEDTQQTIKRGGYYTALVREGLRIVSLNMNFGHDENWWLALYNRDPAGQLQWLTSVLKQSEKDNEKVHLIGHIPPNHMAKWWHFNFYRIIDRFQHTITGQFYGHTHHDEFHLFYDMETSNVATNIVYLGPSVTTYHDINPGYRVYEIDVKSKNSSMSVVNHHTYIMDLEKVQKTGAPNWELEYSAKEAYDLQDLSPGAWSDLASRMKTDDKLFQQYYRYFYKRAKQGTCDTICREHHLCPIKSTRTGVDDYCNFNKEQKEVYSTWWKNTYNKC